MTRMFESKWIPIALLGGFLIFELLLSVWTGHPYDMEVWFKTGMWMNQGINIYLPPNHIGYAPLWALWCGVANIFYTSFGNNLELWRLIIKLPVIVGHLSLALIVGKFAESRFDPKTARKIFLILGNNSQIVQILHSKQPYRKFQSNRTQFLAGLRVQFSQ